MSNELDESPRTELHNLLQRHRLLLACGGRLRSEAEFRAPLAAAGLAVTGIFGQSRMRLIEARPAASAEGIGT